jgi:two-component system chemotaxis sensor kinase CheA
MSELDDIRSLYSRETYEHLNDISRKLIELEEDKTNLKEALSEIYTLAQSIKGDSNALGLIKIGTEAKNIEDFVSKLQKETETYEKEKSHQILFTLIDNIRVFLEEEVSSNIIDKIDEKKQIETNIEFKDGFASGIDGLDEIKKMYVVEALEHLENITNRLLDIETERMPLENALVEIYRDVHSIKGDSNAIGLHNIGEVAHQLESLMTKLQKDSSLYNKNILEELFDFTEKIKVLVENVNKANEVNTLINTTIVKEEEISSSFDEDLVTVYINESLEHVKNIDYFLNSLKNSTNDIVIFLEEIYRESHSIKGDSNSLGFHEIGDIAGELEILTYSIQKNPDEIEDDTFDKMILINSRIKTALEIKSGSNKELLELNENTTNSLPNQETLLDVDISEDMFEMYSEETLEHISNIKNIIVSLEEINLKVESEEDLATLYREAHSIKGDSNSLGFSNIGSIAHELEFLVGDIRKNLDNLTEDSVLKMKALNTKIEDTLELYSKKRKIETTESLETHDDVDEDIFKIFIDESKEHVNNMAKLILQLEEDQTKKEDLFREMYREAHSLKGDSNALGLYQIGEVAHEFESLITHYQKENITLTQNDFDKMFSFNQKILDLVKTTKDKKEDKVELVSENEVSKVIEGGIKDLKKFYFVEAQEHLEYIDKDLLLLESRKTPLSIIVPEIFRRIHSLKGDSFAMGFPTIGEKSHELENYLKKFQEKPDLYNTLSMEEIFKFVNRIKELLVEEAEKMKGEVKPLNLRITASNMRNTLNGQNKEIEATKNMLLNALDIEKAKAQANQQVQKQEDETIRVSVQKIDKIVNLSGELLISKISQDQMLVDIKNMEEELQSYMSFTRRQISKTLNPLEIKIHNEHLEYLKKFDENISQIIRNVRKENTKFSFLIDELQYDSRNTRMLPASVLTDPMRIITRNTSKKLGKKVALTIIGETIEIDRFLIEKLKDPLSHILRNAIDHGIESEEERLASNKPEQSNVLMNISLSGNNVIFEITDDGKGLNYKKIKEKAISNGIVTPEQLEVMTEEEIKQLIFVPGFSTADKVTDVSGRGVGLDVVKSMIDELSGKIFVASEYGKGTIFKLSLPLTLTTFEGFLVKAGSQVFAVPKSFVLRTLSIHSNEIVKTNNDMSIIIDEQPVKVIFLSDILNIPAKPLKNYMVFVLEAGSYTLALVVDEIMESKKMFMKNLGTQLKRVKNFSGTTILGTGEPVLIINVSDITGTIFSSVSFVSTALEATIKEATGQKVEKSKKRVLVVDDSLTTRTLEKNILEFAGFEVILAKHGLEGKEMVEKHIPDLVLSDVEMPKMNGFEFTSWIKKDSPFSNIPVIMVTSLASDEFKKKGIEAGADSYIIKGQFDQKKLIDTINELL